jgi:hypothetical protein
MCEHETQVRLGVLGDILWCRCRDCGLDVAHPAVEDEEFEDE